MIVSRQFKIRLKGAQVINGDMACLAFNHLHRYRSKSGICRTNGHQWQASDEIEKIQDHELKNLGPRFVNEAVI